MTDSAGAITMPVDKLQEFTNPEKKQEQSI
jgi:hypothetical protein